MNIIITGASKGIGKAIAEQFAGGGHRLLLCARTESTLQQTADQFRQRFPQAEINTMAVDLSDKASVLKFGDWCLQFGATDILVNNTGVYFPGSIAEEPDDNLEKMMNTNLFSAYHLTRKLLPAMKEKNAGHIFNICSVASLHAYEGGGSYSISKFALDGFNKNLRHELKSSGIKVTGVYPGAVMTDSWGDFDNSAGRIMEASDVAIMVVAAVGLSKQAVVEEIVLRPQLGDL